MESNSPFLPEDLEIEILLRLPVKSLLRFLSVCKRWRALIQSPSFTTHYDHLSNSRDKKLVLFGKYPISKPQVFKHQTNEIIEDLEFPSLLVYNKNFEKPKFREDIENFREDIQILGPINGIYLIYNKPIKSQGSWDLILWNPATRASKKIVSPLHLDQFFQYTWWSTQLLLGLHVGFGYDESTKDYKVVAISFWDLVYGWYNPGKYCHVKVYNNATNSWSNNSCYEFGLTYRNREVRLPYINSDPNLSNCFVNGKCHWSCGIRCINEEYGSDIMKYGFLVFDMANETFDMMIGPNHMSIEYVSLEDNRNLNRSVWGLRDTIVVVATFEREEKVKVWIMKEYGVEESWNILCSIPVGSNKGLFDVVGIYNEERIVLCDNDERKLISYGFDDNDDEVIEHDVQNKLPHIKYGSIGMFNYVENFARIH